MGRNEYSSGLVKNNPRNNGKVLLCIMCVQQTRTVHDIIVHIQVAERDPATNEKPSLEQKAALKTGNCRKHMREGLLFGSLLDRDTKDNVVRESLQFPKSPAVNRAGIISNNFVPGIQRCLEPSKEFIRSAVLMRLPNLG